MASKRANWLSASQNNQPHRTNFPHCTMPSEAYRQMRGVLRLLDDGRSRGNFNLDEEAQAGFKDRSKARSSIFLAAVLRDGPKQAPVKVRNMSPIGAMLDSPLTPIPGTKVELIRGTLIAQGTVIWSSNNRCGLRFSSEVSVEQWLAAPTSAQQERVDEIAYLAKTGAIHGATGETTTANQAAAAPPKRELIEGLQVVVRLMHALETELASSPETISRHGTRLQHLDIAIQMIQAIARELGPARDTEPDNLAKLADLRAVCAQALAENPVCED